MSSLPHAGSVTSAAVTAVQPDPGSASFAAGVATIGPFDPQAGKEIWVALSGTWAGTVQLMRSTDGGFTKLPLTVAGTPWGIFYANANEQVVSPSDTQGSYYLVAAITSGTLAYRMAQ
jgi:hypothetical protein